MFVSVLLVFMLILPPLLVKVALLSLIVWLVQILVHALHVLLDIKLILPLELVLFSLVLSLIVILALPILLTSASHATLAIAYKQQVLLVFLSVVTMQ